MNSSSWVLSEEQLRDWLHELIESESSVIAPSEEDGVLLFRRCTSTDSAVISPAGKTRWSPKEFLFPRSEALYRYHFKGDAVQLEDPPSMISRRYCSACEVAMPPVSRASMRSS
jgi:hypothetical protein